MKAEYPELKKEEFQRIYTEKKFRNAVAHAHVCCDAKSKPLYRKAFDYPRAWAVSDEQIAEAMAEIARSAVETLKQNKGKLLLVGMGWPDADIPENDIGNCRARGYFLDKQGKRCFVEINHAERKGKSVLWFDFAHYDNPEEDNKNLLRNIDDPAFSKANVLRYVNRAFKTTFKEVVIDNYDLMPDEFVSIEEA